MSNREILDSWKEIAAYLRRSEKTCRRLEKELGLPVHRLEETPKARVFAYKNEIDRWIQETQHSEEISLTAAEITEAYKLKKFLIPVLVLVAIMAIGIIIWRVLPNLKQKGEQEAVTLQKPEIDPNRIAVAIFENRTGNPELDHLGFMAHDWITQGLQRIGDVSVAGEVPDKELEVGEQNTDFIQWISDETYAGKVVTGAYYLQGETLQFHSQLHDATEGKLLHALDPAIGSIKNPMGTIETLRQKVMSQLAIYGYEKWRSFIKPETELPDYEAYLEFTEGLRIFLRMEYKKAIEYFKRACELDPDFLTPLFFWFAASTNLGAYVEAEPLLKKLEQNRDRLSPINRLLLDFLKGSLTGNRFDQYTAIRQAAQLDRDNNYLYGLLAIWVNRPREAITAFKALDPEIIWVPYWRKLTMAYHMLGEHELELAEARLGRKIHPEMIDLIFCEMRANAALGRIDEIDSWKHRTQHYSSHLLHDSFDNTVKT